MRPYLPSLQSLLAFEAAARHLSFTRAAQELELTQTAISHQIKTLEERLGTKLFVRLRNVLSLTPAAREYLATVNDAISMLSIATERTRQKKTNTVLTVTCLPTYATTCLIPALPEFQDLYPDITIHLATSATFDEFERNTYDVAIRYGSGRWPSVSATLLQAEEFFPVCAPGLLVGKEGASTSEVLRSLRQIRTYFYSMFQDDWPKWLEAAGLPHAEFHSESVFHLQLTSLSAAIEGVGIAIGRTPLVDRDLARGLLVEPFDIRVRSSSGYYATAPTSKSKLDKVRVFTEWIQGRLGAGA